MKRFNPTNPVHEARAERQFWSTERRVFPPFDKKNSYKYVSKKKRVSPIVSASEGDPDAGIGPVVKENEPPCRAAGRADDDRLRHGCHTEIVMGDQPALRFCSGFDKPGPLVPIDRPEDAYAVAKKVCDCAGGGGKGRGDPGKIKDPKRLKSCAMKAKGSTPELGEGGNMASVTLLHGPRPNRRRKPKRSRKRRSEFCDALADDIDFSRGAERKRLQRKHTKLCRRK